MRRVTSSLELLFSDRVTSACLICALFHYLLAITFHFWGHWFAGQILFLTSKRKDGNDDDDDNNNQFCHLKEGKVGKFLKDYDKDDSFLNKRKENHNESSDFLFQETEDMFKIVRIFHT